MSDETKALETIKENGLVLGSKKDNSMVAQFEKLIDSIIDAKVQEAIEHMDAEHVNGRDPFSDRLLGKMRALFDDHSVQPLNTEPPRDSE